LTLGVASSNPRNPRSITTSTSSEKRSISFQHFESDVPPLNVKLGPHSGSANSSRRVHVTQRSFSMLDAGRPSCGAADWQSA
jgi:hypothetical protein